MFNTPTRNHISIIVERLKMVFVVLVIGILNIFGNSEEDILSAEYWRNLMATAKGAQDYIYALSGLGFVAVCSIVVLISFLFGEKPIFT